VPGRMRDPGPRVGAPRLDGEVRDAYDDWTIGDLRRRAAEVGIEGRSRMRKDDLIKALRSR